MAQYDRNNCMKLNQYLILLNIYKQVAMDLRVNMYTYYI